MRASMRAVQAAESCSQSRCVGVRPSGSFASSAATSSSDSPIFWANRMKAMRRSVEAHKGAYCIGQALRTRRYAKGLSALLRASLRDPRHAPRQWLVAGAALAGL